LVVAFAVLLLTPRFLAVAPLDGHSLGPERDLRFHDKLVDGSGPYFYKLLLVEAAVTVAVLAEGA